MSASLSPCSSVDTHLASPSSSSSSADARRVPGPRGAKGRARVDGGAAEAAAGGGGRDASAANLLLGLSPRPSPLQSPPDNTMKDAGLELVDAVSLRARPTSTASRRASSRRDLCLLGAGAPARRRRAVDSARLGRRQDTQDASAPPASYGSEAAVMCMLPVLPTIPVSRTPPLPSLLPPPLRLSGPLDLFGEVFVLRALSVLVENTCIALRCAHERDGGKRGRRRRGGACEDQPSRAASQKARAAPRRPPRRLLVTLRCALARTRPARCRRPPLLAARPAWWRAAPTAGAYNAGAQRWRAGARARCDHRGRRPAAVPRPHRHLPAAPGGRAARASRTGWRTRATQCWTR